MVVVAVVVGVAGVVVVVDVVAPFEFNCVRLSLDVDVVGVPAAVCGAATFASLLFLLLGFGNVTNETRTWGEL